MMVSTMFWMGLYIVAGLLALVSGPASLVQQVDVNLTDSVTLLCDGPTPRDVPVGQLDVQWLTKDHLVTRFSGGKLTEGTRYENRIEMSVESISQGDFSLTIKRSEFSDTGLYRCLSVREGQATVLRRVELKVMVPNPRALFVQAGQHITLPRYGNVDLPEFLQWKRSGGQLVLEWSTGSFYTNPHFKGRVSVPRERILRGDLSLILNSTRQHEQGIYICFFSSNMTILPTKSIYLTVTEYNSTVPVVPGSSVPIPLRSAGPVRIWFLKDGSDSPVLLCDVKQDHAQCEPDYSHRVSVQNGTLSLANVTPADMGAYSVRDTDSDRTINVVFTVTSTGLGQMIINGDRISWLIIVVLIIVVLIIVVLNIVLLWQRRKRVITKTVMDSTDNYTGLLDISIAKSPDNIEDAEGRIQTDLAAPPIQSKLQHKPP